MLCKYNNYNYNKDNYYIKCKMTDEVNIYKMKYDEIIKSFNEVNLDKLKDICRDNNISGYSSLNKPDVINLILQSYNTSRTTLNKVKYNDLLDICRTHKLITSDSKSLSKDMLIHIIISTTNIKNKIIKHPVILDQEITFSIEELIEKQKNNVAVPVPVPVPVAVPLLVPESVDVSNNTIDINDKLSNHLDELIQLKQKLDLLRKEKLDRDNFIKTEEQLIEKKLLKIKKKTENKKKRLEAEVEKEKKRLEKESQETKLKENEVVQSSNVVQPSKGRRPLPSSVRDSVWNHYIGEDINKHRCLCCKKVLITNRRFEVGHVISVTDGGTDEINNLRPICSPCNHSMGSKHMVEFVKMYGYYIG